VTFEGRVNLNFHDPVWDDGLVVDELAGSCPNQLDGMAAGQG